MPHVAQAVEKIVKENKNIGVFSDAHGNIHAFKAACRLMQSFGVEQMIYLGDAVGYIPSTSVLKETFALGDQVKCIKGNHEQMLLAGSFDSVHSKVYGFSRLTHALSGEDRNRLAQWPMNLNEKFGCYSCFFVHGSPSDFLNGYIYPDTNLAAFDVQADYVFVGHSHYPFVKKQGCTTFVNVGSCGLPRDDGRYGSFAIFDFENGDVEIWRFSIEKTVEKLLSSHTDIDESVIKVFSRRRTDIIGRLIVDNES